MSLETEEKEDLKESVPFPRVTLRGPGFFPAAATVTSHTGGRKQVWLIDHGAQQVTDRGTAFFPAVWISEDGPPLHGEGEEREGKGTDKINQDFEGRRYPLSASRFLQKFCP